MADNYTFLDATGTTQTAGSSVIGGVNYPIVKIPDPVTVNINSGSIIGVALNSSILGTYAEDSAHSSGQPGLFTLNVRNDTMSSITSTDGDYSPMAVGPIGEVLVANAPLTKWVQGVASCFTGVIQPVIPAGGSSIFTYVTSAQITNTSANNVYLTVYGAASSVVSFIPVPANSGALPLMVNGWKSNANGAFSASVSGVSSVFVAFQGFISKT